MEEKDNKYLTVTRFEVETRLNNYLGDLKVEGMSSTAKFAIVKLKHELSNIIRDIEDFRKKTMESIEKPEGFTELMIKLSKGELTDEEKARYDELKKEYTDKFVEIAIPFFNGIIQIPFDFINEKDFKALLEHNDINTVLGYEYLYDKLVK